LLLLPLAGFARAADYDVAVYGATLSGIAAALNAAASGRTVALVDPNARIGGMAANGLSFSDFRSLEALGGTYRDYTRRVERYYIGRHGAGSQQVKDCYFGTLAEPNVALTVMKQMLAEQPRVRVFIRHRLESVAAAPPRRGLAAIRSAAFTDLTRGGRLEIPARFFIDATYEGDLAARAGARYRIGRESTRDYGERFAGVIYFEGGRILPGSTGEGDRRVQCYNYRILMTREASNRVAVARPARYDRAEYVASIPHFRSGRLQHAFSVNHDGVLRIQMIPNGKSDMNDIKNAPLRLSLPGENNDYPEGSPEVRARILERHKDYALGLIWFLQNDPEVPEPIRREANEWGLAKDEFEESGHFPEQLYIREARRIEGEYKFREQDALMAPGSVRAPVHADAIAIGDYALNCHGERKPGPIHPSITEGDFGYADIAPFQVPYGILVPKGVANLLVPVAVSATHVGYSCLRLEPTYTAMGQAAGIAAHLALEAGAVARDVPPERIQEILHARGAKTVYVTDVEPGAPLFLAAQYFGTRGFFADLRDPRRVVYQGWQKRYSLQYAWAMPEHALEPEKPLDRALAGRWLARLPEGELRAKAAADPALRADGTLTRGAFLERLYRLCHTRPAR
jgi:hypothetical protein